MEGVTEGAMLTPGPPCRPGAAVRTAHTPAGGSERVHACAFPVGPPPPPPVTLALWLPRALTADGASGRDQVTIASHPAVAGPSSYPV